MSTRPSPPPGDAQTLLNAAVAHHQAGRLKDADAIYRQILAAFPDHFDARHLLGVIALQTGRFGEAQSHISRAIAISPTFAAAHNNLGNVYLRQGRLDEAQASFLRAVELQPDLGDAHFNLANQFRRQGRLQDAATHFKRVVALNGASLPARVNLGATLLDMGDARGAVREFETAAKLKPGDADTFSNLGIAVAHTGDSARALDILDRALKLNPASKNALSNRGTVLARMGRYAEARTCLERVLKEEPASAVANCNLGNVVRDSGAPSEAIAHYRRAIELDATMVAATIGLAQSLREVSRGGEARDMARRIVADHPHSAAALVLLGTLCEDDGDIVAAGTAYQQAIALESTNADAHYQLGNILLNRMRSKEAVESYRRALAADPAYDKARWALTMAEISPIYQSTEALSASRANLARSLAELDAWFNPARPVDADKVVGSTQPFYLAYQPFNNRDLLARYGSLCARLMEVWRKQHLTPTTTRTPGKLRIGIASAHLREHSVWNAIVKGWLKHLDRNQFEVHLFSLSARSDSETEQSRRWAHRLTEGRRSLKEWATTIAASDLDVLIYPEIGMDAITAKLASLRLARVQAATWGHPETTGLPTIDYYLSAEDLEPPGADAHYTERVVALPHLGVCYEPLSPAPVAVDLVSLGLPANVPLLLCAGTPFKYSPLHDNVWIEIARRAAPCKLVFFRPSDVEASAEFEARLARRFADAGVPYAERVAFIHRLDRGRYYGLMQRAHAMLDTLGFSGFNTVMQAIECGLPVVSREGEFMRGRLGSGILRRMGMDSLVTISDDDYIELAIGIARDWSRRMRLADEIVARRSVLFADQAPVRALESFLTKASAPQTPV